MVFIIIKNGSKICLNDRKHKIGRRSINHIVVKDPSISKEHALLFTEGDKVFIKDLNSKRGTFVNGKKIKSPLSLKSSDKIKFGFDNNEIQFWDLDWTTSVSEITENHKEKLLKALNNCHVNIADTWSNDCTHITTHKITLNAEMLCALVEGIPFVTPRFWFTLEECVRVNNFLPNECQYIPPWDESWQNAGLEFNPKLRREYLFEGRIFVVFNEEKGCAFERLVENCGATALFWEKLSKEKKLNISDDPNLLFVDNGSINEYIDTANLKNIFSKREIYVCIVKCSSQLYSAGKYIGDVTPERTGNSVHKADSTTPDFLDNLVDLSAVDGGETSNRSSTPLTFRKGIKRKMIGNHSDQTKKRSKNRRNLVWNPFAKAQERKTILRLESGPSGGNPNIIDLTGDNSSEWEE